MPQASKVGDGNLRVTTAGTRSTLVGSAGTALGAADPTGPIRTVAVQALGTNTTAVAVGGPNVVAATGNGQRGALLTAGQSISLDTDDLADVYVDVRTNGEGVSFVWNA